MLFSPAHQYACEKASILHRDISIGNIIICSGQGFLIDWELSCKLSDEEARILERTVRIVISDLTTTDPSQGTWQFLSIKLLRAPAGTHLHGIADDLESFIWLLLWIAAKYAAHSFPADDLKDFLTEFDYNPNQQLYTGKDRTVAQDRYAVYRLRLKTLPFQKFLADLMHTLHLLYAEPSAVADLHPGLSKPEIEEMTKRLQSHKWMMETIVTALENEQWRDTDDPSEKHDVPLRAQSTVRARNAQSVLTSSWRSSGSKRAPEGDSTGSSSSKKQRLSDASTDGPA
jgi:hypothetical protein